VDEDSDYEAIGVPIEWIPWVRKAGYNTIEGLTKANPNKLANDLNGIRKKNKLDISPLNAEIIANWQKS
jgi:lysyl-tRNA synthetase, class II